MSASPPPLLAPPPTGSPTGPAGGHATEPSPRVRQALLTLQRSRQALHAELVPVVRSEAPRHGRSGAMARLWWWRLRRWPAVQLVREALHPWWQRHPLQPLATGLAAGARTQLWPLLRRHPWLSVGLAAAFGAAVVAARPWRWAWVDRQLRRAPGAASGWLVRQLSAAPVQATLVSLAALLMRPPAPSGAAPQEEPHGTP